MAITSAVTARKSTENREMSDWILLSSPGGSGLSQDLGDERWAGHSAAMAPTRTYAGLSEHFAVKEESQESVGWSLKRFPTN